LVAPGACLPWLGSVVVPALLVVWCRVLLAVV
jgi:hypothetical protein